MLTVTFIIAVLAVTVLVSEIVERRRPKDTRHASLRYADKLKARGYRGGGRGSRDSGGSGFFGDFGGGGDGGGDGGGGGE